MPQRVDHIVSAAPPRDSATASRRITKRNSSLVPHQPLEHDPRPRLAQLQLWQARPGRAFPHRGRASAASRPMALRPLNNNYLPPVHRAVRARHTAPIPNEGLHCHMRNEFRSRANIGHESRAIFTNLRAHVVAARTPSACLATAHATALATTQQRRSLPTELACPLPTLNKVHEAER